MPQRLYKQEFKNIGFDFKNENLIKKYQELKNLVKNDEIKPISAIFDEENVKKIEELSFEIKKYEKILVLGVGGSSLGGKTLTSLKNQDKLFFLESIDPETLHNSLQKIDFEKTFFLIISKSGETIETLCQALIIFDKIGHQNLKKYAKNFLVITESNETTLAKIALENGIKIFHHPKNIGGRFSCFSITGLLPAFICDIDVRKILEGGKTLLRDFLENDNNFVVQSCLVQNFLYENNCKNNVMMPYIDILKNFTDWYRQLWAESLGKNGFGLTPINSMGTVDQHSQLQLYLEGPKDKFYNFFTLKNRKFDFEIKDFENCKTLFGGKKLSQIVDVEQDTTIDVLDSKKLPIRIFEIQNLNEEVMGSLMMQMFLETILMAHYQKINPFDQPAVELRKNIAREILQNM